MKCRMCNKDKDETSFPLRNNRKRGRQYYCKECYRNSMSAKRLANKIKSVNMLGGKCSSCGYNKCLAALEFHHTDGDKEHEPARLLQGSWDAVKKELAKCVLLCSNCHREEHNDC